MNSRRKGCRLRSIDDKMEDNIGRVRTGNGDITSDEEFDVNGKKKRKTIDTTAYDDDSENEEPFDSDKEDEPEQDAEEKDDDSDMFSEEEESKPGHSKDVLNMNQFESENKIEAERRRHGEDSDEEYYEADLNDEEHSEEPKLDAFDLRNEMREGTFTATGEYIEATHPTPAIDEWKSFKKDDIQKAKQAQKDRQQRLKQMKLAKDQNPDNSSERLLFKLITVLQPVESPMEALQRLNKLKPKKKGKRLELSEADKGKERLRQQTVTDITEFCEMLMEQGFKDVYGVEREELMLKYKDEVGETYVRPKEEGHGAAEMKQTEDEPRKWEFRWIGDTTIHGPYTATEMAHWKETHFQDRVQARLLGTDDFTEVGAVSFN